jgi:uncharacterized membrane protein
VSRGTVILLAVALVCAGAGIASIAMLRGAEDPEAELEDDADDDDDGPGAEMQAKAKICKKLSCTESQRGELGTLIRAFRDETRDRRTEVKNLRASAAELWASAEPDTTRVTELETRVWTLEGEVEARAREALLTFHRVLDEEQRRKLSKWLRRKSARDLLQDRRNREPEAAQ